MPEQQGIQDETLNKENLEEETMSFNDHCGSPTLETFDVPADAIANKEEYIDEP
ncbi:hypothetical protein [Paenibacillus alkalitolerans]|uniref:hypothetical protein n=1 Tax=Paenibacillus alkalitolerans TaxID=2799335 RepID=UPI0018F7053F|nr:hypothetical protein [Paenibacillus alkalitolerans]